jgi:hypothetical protein
MDLHIEWLRARELTDGSKSKLIYSADTSGVPKLPGVYVFGRWWGDGFEALYVGRSENLKGRIEGQLKWNVRLMRHIQEASTGTRYVAAGVFKAKKGQRAEKCLPILERSLIRYFLARGDDLVNVHGTRIREHSINSKNRPQWFLPKVIYDG